MGIEVYPEAWRARFFNPLDSVREEEDRAARLVQATPIRTIDSTDELVRQIARMTLTDEADGRDLDNDTAMDGLIRRARSITA